MDIESVSRSPWTLVVYLIFAEYNMSFFLHVPFLRWWIARGSLRERSVFLPPHTHAPTPPHMRRHPTTDGGFVDLPWDDDGAVVLRVVAENSPETAAGVYLRGEALAADGDGWTVVSCGGLLARLPTRLAPQERVRLHAAR